MTTAIPVIDVEAARAGDRAQLDAVRTATRDLGTVQVVNHGVPQIQGPDGGWIAVPLIPGALQVFSGHLLTRWTGGRLRPAGPGRRLAGRPAVRG